MKCRVRDGRISLGGVSFGGVFLLVGLCTLTSKTHDAYVLAPRRSSIARATMILIAVLGIGGVGALVALRGQIFGSVTTAEPDPPSAAEDLRRAALPDKVTVDLQGLPEGAEVLIDGAAAGAPPIRLPRGERRHQLLVRAPGRQPRAIEIDGTRDRVVELELAPMPAPGTMTTSTTTAAPAGTRGSETTAATRRNARDGRKRGAGESGRRGVTGTSEPTTTSLAAAETPTPPQPKTNPPKPAHSSYDEM